MQNRKFQAVKSSEDMISFKMSAPSPSAFMKIMVDALPGTIVRNVHRKLMSEIAKRGKQVMVQEIKKQFRVADAKKPRANGEPRRWQTPTGALANSIGIKIPTLTQMRNPKAAYAVIGPRKDFKVTKAVRKRVERMTTLGLNTERGTPFGSPKPAPAKIHIPKGPKGERVSPSRYAHLANFGHTPGGSPAGIWADPHDYMTPTVAKMSLIIMSIVKSQHEPLLIKTLKQDTANRLRSIARQETKA